MTLSDFIGNEAVLYGGAVHCTLNSAPTIDGCTMTGNTADRGGAIACRTGSNALVMECDILGNTATTNGGGIDAYDSSPTVRGCTIAGGNAGHHGGGIICHNSGSLIDACLVSNNSGTSYGGGLSCWESSAVTVQGCTFYSNVTTGLGSEVHSRNSATSIENSILAFGQAGGAVYSEAGGSILLSCSDIFGNAGGDWTGEIAGQLGLNGNFTVDLLFCDADGGDFTLHSDSPCAPGNHPDGAACGLIGAFDVGCGPTTAVEHSSWGEVKSMFR